MSFISIANTTNISSENHSYTVGCPLRYHSPHDYFLYLCFELCNKTKNNLRLNWYPEKLTWSELISDVVQSFHQAVESIQNVTVNSTYNMLILYIALKSNICLVPKENSNLGYFHYINSTCYLLIGFFFLEVGVRLDSTTFESFYSGKRLTVFGISNISYQTAKQL